jgi:GT2 family glycosyltransferase
MPKRLQITVGIATAGRREQLARTLRQLEGQTRRPDEVIVCPAHDDDFDAAAADGLSYTLRTVRSAKGLTTQRNAILSVLGPADIVVFFDDDFYPAHNYLGLLERIFCEHPDVAVVTSWPNLDGATGPGIPHDRALAALDALPNSDAVPYTFEQTYGAYGCNMAFRASLFAEHHLRFDERLPLYSWLEDIDLSRRAVQHGRLVGCRALQGVHLAHKHGRPSGTRLGYSQVVNPLYLVQKGSLSRRYALRQIARNLASNLIRSLAPEPWVDRRGRLRGNLLAARDLLTTKPDPMRALHYS